MTEPQTDPLALVNEVMQELRLLADRSRRPAMLFYANDHGVETCSPLGGGIEWTITLQDGVPTYRTIKHLSDTLALIVGWVMEGCAQRGWFYSCDNIDVGVEFNILPQPERYPNEWAGDTHPTSLALAALRAYRAALEAK